MSLPLLPHRALPVGATEWGAWVVAVNHAEPQTLPEALDGWDYASELRFGVTSSVSPDAVAECLGGYPPNLVNLVGIADCRATLRRFVTSTPLSQDGSGSLTIHVARGSSAGHLVLSQHLVLGRELSQNDWSKARRKGSRLASDTSVRVQLEGGPERFPTESLSFSAVGLEDIPWKLQFDATDPFASFRGSVRLLVNTDHPAGQALLDPSHALFQALTSVVKVSTVHQLLGSVDVEALVGDQHFDPDSLAAAATALANVWLGLDLEEAVRLEHDDPVAFWDRLSARAELLRALP